MGLSTGRQRSDGAVRKCLIFRKLLRGGVFDGYDDSVNPARLMIFILGLLVLSHCSSTPSNHNDSRPDWTRQPARTVDQGYIVYIPSDEDSSPERARFKAEAQAIEDLANECSLAPKGARIEDHFDLVIGRLHQSFVKVAVDFQACEEARNALHPEDFQKLANVAMTEEVKRYQDEIEKPVLARNTEDGEEGDDVAANEAISNDTNPMLNQTRTPVFVAIQTGPQFFIVRQQIAYAKEVVILSPPQAYPPGAPQTVAFENNLRPVARNVTTYEKANPEVRTSPHTWSSYRRQAQQQRRTVRNGKRNPKPDAKASGRGKGRRKRQWGGSGEEPR